MAVTDDLQLIGQTPPLLPAELQVAYQSARQRRVERDAYFYHQGDPATAFYILIEGQVKLTEVTSDGQKLIVKGEDTLVKRPITIPFDMVVHAIGMDPNIENPSIAKVFDVRLQEHGHIARANAYGTLGHTSREGVFVAGAATGPETIDDSIAQGNAAAMAAFALARGKAPLAA